MVESYKKQSKIANAIVFLAGLISYIGKDAIAQILPKEFAYLAPILVLIAGYIIVQNTENTRVERAEQLILENVEQ